MTAISISVTNSAYAVTAAILDAMAAASVTALTPVYYETVLVNKGLRDELSLTMLQIMMDSKTFDLGFLNNWGGSKDLCFNMINAGGKFASVIATYEEKVNEDYGSR